MNIRIHAESTSGATEIDKIRLRDTVQYIASKLNFDCYGILSDIVWIIYNPLYSEEQDKKNSCQTTVQAMIAEMEENRMKILRQYGVIDFKKKYRPEYGYCYIPTKRIYISINQIRQSPIVFGGGTSIVIQKVIYGFKNLPGINRNLRTILQKSKAPDIPKSLKELVLHEMMHVVTGKSDDEEDFWTAFEEVKRKIC